MPGELFAEIDFALSSAATASPLEREKLIDAALWRKLDELEICHEMDFEHLCIYRMRLQLLEKYKSREIHIFKDRNEARKYLDNIKMTAL
jgi:hypothetical protein